MAAQRVRCQTVNRLYCRDCRTDRDFRFAGWAADGSENGVRPRAYLQVCMSCGLTILTLGNVHDTEGLCWSIARKRVGHVTGADVEDAAAFLQAQCWGLYLKWLPNVQTFASYATHWLPIRLGKWIIEVTGRDDRRRDPKPHAVSGPIDDAYGVGVDRDDAFRAASDDAGAEIGGLVADLRFDPDHPRHYLAGDLGGILRGRDRRGVGLADVRGQRPAA